MGDAKRRKKIMGSAYGQSDTMKTFMDENPLFAMMDIPETEWKNHPDLHRQAMIQLMELNRELNLGLKFPDDPEKLEAFIQDTFKLMSNARIQLPDGMRFPGTT